MEKKRLSIADVYFDPKDGRDLALGNENVIQLVVMEFMVLALDLVSA